MGEKLPVPVFLDNMQGHIYKKRETGGVFPVSSSFSAPRIPYARACPAPFSSAFLSGHRAHAAVRSGTAVRQFFLPPSPCSSFSCSRSGREVLPCFFRGMPYG